MKNFKMTTGGYQTKCRALLNSGPCAATWVTGPRNQHYVGARCFAWQAPHRAQACRVWLCRLYTAQLWGTPFTIPSAWQPCQRCLQPALDSGCDPQLWDREAILAMGWCPHIQILPSSRGSGSSSFASPFLLGISETRFSTKLRCPGSTRVLLGKHPLLRVDRPLAALLLTFGVCS